MKSWKLVAWNVNSVKARLERLTAFLEKERPDVVCLQELKCIDEHFPTQQIKGLGYHVATHGQRTYNGVAVLSTAPIEVIGRGFDAEDPQARYLAVRTFAANIASCYIPNGQAVGTDKYAYKLEWLRKFRDHLDKTFSSKDPLALCGDFNIAPEDRDVHDPEQWRGQVLFSEPEKEALKRICQFGLSDTFRKHHDQAGQFSWWDYRNLAFPKNLGLRIDFILATPSLYDRCVASGIERNERKGKLPSDHAPVFAEFRVE